MRASLALGFALVAALLSSPANAFNSSKNIELLEVNEAIDEYGLMTFAGMVQNTHTTQPVIAIKVYVILKQGSRIVAIYEHPLKAQLLPGESHSFLVETDYAEGDYDTFEVRLAGLTGAPDPSFVIGELVVLEESLSLTHSPDGETVLYGEIFNGTNAIINSIELFVYLYDARDRSVGIAFPHLGLVQIELWPGEKIDFAAIADLSSDSKIVRWDISMEFEPLRIIEEDVVTGVAEATWGQVKQGRGR